MSVLPGHKPGTPQLPDRSLFHRVVSDALEQIQRAAVTLWPERQLTFEQHVPSVTSYVHRVRVGADILYAKVPYLGMSLVSLLRGSFGTGPEISSRQRKYAITPNNLAVREATQLALLARLGNPQVCRLAGVCNGVLFTTATTGPTLADLMLARPDATTDLLRWPLTELQALRAPAVRVRANLVRFINERSVSGTFARKFHGTGSLAYMHSLGVERCRPDECAAVVERLHRSISRLHRLRSATLPVTRPALVYGDLKPEHVVFSNGPDTRPTLLDPSLMHTHPAADLAKLISRTVLVLVGRPARPTSVDKITDAINTVASSRAHGVPRGVRHAWFRELTTLWLMDTLNITTTFLSAPAELPLPRQAEAVVTRAARVADLVDAMSSDLVTSRHTIRTWDRALVHVREALS